MEESVVAEGSDGEEEFDKKILKAAIGKVVLDVGCGDAIFTARIAELAREVVGVDFSQKAISRALANITQTHATNIRVQRATANRLPFPEETFDLVVSRRGPVSDSARTLSEAYRILRKGGLFMEITIGERDKENLIRIFRRGQMQGVQGKVSAAKEKMLRVAGFDVVEVKEYLAYEIFQTLQDLVIRLKSAPIIPDFDIFQDKASLEAVKRTLSTLKGIRTEVHRVTVIGRK